MGTNTLSYGGIVVNGYGNVSLPSGVIPSNQAGDLWVRNDGNADNGLRVCSAAEGHVLCVSGTGDYNEPSQLRDNEAIRLTAKPGASWTGVWVSSLDPNGSEGFAERGTLSWSNPSGTAIEGSFNFDYNELPGSTAVEENLLTDFTGIAGFGSFDPNARYLIFANNGVQGHNNDYLVWVVDVKDGGNPNDERVPEPASLLVIGTGLIGQAAARRRLARAA